MEIVDAESVQLAERNCDGYGLAKYPWIRNPNNLPNNYEQAARCLEHIEKRLSRDKEYAKKYSDQIDDMLARGVARKLSEKENDTYDGPVFYIAHHAVIKESSKTTPLRIVFNSSKKYQGHCINDYWAKGPDGYINNLLGCLLKFRENYIGIIGDIRKMYNSVRISSIDQHCHRFLWRGMNCSISPYIYIYIYYHSS